MQRILIQREKVCYRLLGFEFRDHADGSFYVEFKTTPDGRPAIREKISYHATGRIKFSGPLDHVAFGDPIFALSELQEIACVSLYDLDALEKVTDIRGDDQIIRTESKLGRTNLYLFVGPDDDTKPPSQALTIAYAGWFRFHIAPGGPPPVEIGDDCSRILAASSRYDTQRISQSQGLIFFHQKRTGAKGEMFFWDSKERVGRIIFAVPMRIHPTLEIEFADPTFTAVPQAPTVLNTATADLRFKVRGAKGFVSEMPPFKTLALHAEL